MDTKFEGLAQTQESIVYVRPVAVAGLPEELRAQIGDLATVYSVNRPDGEQLALVADRKMAFALARDHDLAPVNAH
jgi:hypothetical protein